MFIIFCIYEGAASESNTPTIVNVVQRKLMLPTSDSDGDEVSVIIEMYADLCR